MRKIVMLAIWATALVMSTVNAQDVQKPGNLLPPKSDENIARMRRDALAAMKDEKDKIVAYEKDVLKKEIERIDLLITKDSISVQRAQELKEIAAKRAAMNIDNKSAIVDNQMALMERGESYNPKVDNGNTLELGFGNAYDDNGSMLLGFHYRHSGVRVKYDRRTTSDFVIAWGLNNVTLSNSSFTRQPYRWGKSGFAEFGFTFQTRLRKDDNFFRLRYGVSFQVSSLSPESDRYFVDDNQGHTTLATSPHQFKFNRMTFTNLVFPAYLEFGKSDKVISTDRIRYKTNNHMRYGIGAYGGFNIRTSQWLKWKEDGNTHQTKTIEDFNASNIIYGLGAYAGFGNMSVYFKYDLNPLFKNAPVRQHMFSVALRFDL